MCLLGDVGEQGCLTNNKKIVCLGSGLDKFVFFQIVNATDYLVGHALGDGNPVSCERDVHCTTLYGGEYESLLSSTGASLMLGDVNQVANIETDERCPGILENGHQYPADQRTAMFFFQWLKIDPAEVDVLVKLTCFAFHENITGFRRSV